MGGSFLPFFVVDCVLTLGLLVLCCVWIKVVFTLGWMEVGMLVIASLEHSEHSDRREALPNSVLYSFWFSPFFIY